MAGYKPNDHYARKARKLGYRARSVFKLEEIDQRHGLLAKKNRVLDLGASPGSWAQYASEKVGPDGLIIGVDLTAIDLPLDNAVFLQADVNDPALPEMLAPYVGENGRFHAVLSDMAPKTTGMKFTDQMRSAQLCEMAFWLARQYLLPGGNFVTKMFDSGETQPFKLSLTPRFKKVVVARPKSARKVSSEIFITGLGYIPEPAESESSEENES